MAVLNSNKLLLCVCATLRVLPAIFLRTANRRKLRCFHEMAQVCQSNADWILLAENTRRAYGTFVLKFMEWLVDTGLVHPREADLARLRHQKAFRGFSARQLEKMRMTAVSPDDYVRLIKVIRLEYEECRGLLDGDPEVQDKYDATFPLLPFSMLLGTELALRSAELNHLYVSDLKRH